MSEKPNLPEFPDQKTLLEYLRGGLTPEERHRIEKLMLEHPFFREAVEGLESEDPELIKEDFTELSDTIRVRSAMNTRKGFNVYRFAATVSLIIMTSVILFVLIDWITQSSREKRLSLNQAVQTESKDSMMDKKSSGTEEREKYPGNQAQIQTSDSEQKTEGKPLAETGKARHDTPSVSEQKPEDQLEEEPSGQPGLSRVERMPVQDEESVAPAMVQSAPDKQAAPAENIVDENGQARQGKNLKDRSAVAEADVVIPEKMKSEEAAPSMAIKSAEPEAKPSPVNGIENYRKYLEDSLRYPTEALKKKVEGTVVVIFTIGKDSIPQDIILKKSIGYGCDQEAIRMILQGPPWNPAVIDGKVVDRIVEVPVSFKIQEYK